MINKKNLNNYLFVYGTLLRFFNNRNEFSYYLSKYGKYVNKAYTQGDIYSIQGGLHIYPGAKFIDNGNIIYGELYKIDEDLLNELDIYEGRNYTRKLINIKYKLLPFIYLNKSNVYAYELTDLLIYDDSDKIKSGDFVKYLIEKNKG